MTRGIGRDEHDGEGRTITLEYDTFFLVTVYTPNSQRGLARLDYRLKWEDCFREYVSTLAQTKPVVICGDLNVAHKEIDIKRPEANRRNAGFTDEEREKFTKLLEAGFVDTFRYFHPDKTDAYTWWAYFGKAREKNIGWRIDYFLVSTGLQDKLVDSYIYDHVMGSDHCPVGLELKLA